MEKVNVPISKNMEFEIEQNYKNAMQKSEFVALIKKVGISNEYAKENCTKLLDVLDELKKCKSCKGIYNCKNELEGHVYFPEIKYDRLRFTYIPCKFMKKFNKESEEKVTSKNILLNARMKDIDISDKNRINVIKWLKKFYDSYNPNQNQKGLFLHGSFGAGKTFLIACLFNELKEKKNARTDIVYYPELLRNLREDLEVFESKMHRLKNLDLLLIDDIGAESVTAWGRDEVLGTILQYRMNEGLATFFTSNLNIIELEKHLSMTKTTDDYVKARRIIQRVKQLTDDLELQSENRRK